MKDKQRRELIALCTILILMALALLLTGPFSLLSTDQTGVSNQTTMPKVEAVKSYEDTTHFELIYKQEVRGRHDVLRKYYNHNDHTTIWILRMAGYGDSSIFVMKGKV